MLSSIFTSRSRPGWFASAAPRQTNKQKADAILSEWGLTEPVLGQQRDLITLEKLLRKDNLNPTKYEDTINLLRVAKIDMQEAKRLLSEVEESTVIPDQALVQIENKLKSIRRHSAPAGYVTKKRTSNRRRSNRRRSNRRRSNKRRSNRRRSNRRRSNKYRAKKMMKGGASKTRKKRKTKNKRMKKHQLTRKNIGLVGGNSVKKLITRIRNWHPPRSFKNQRQRDIAELKKLASAGTITEQQQYLLEKMLEPQERGLFPVDWNPQQSKEQEEHVKAAQRLEGEGTGGMNNERSRRGSPPSIEVTY